MKGKEMYLQPAVHQVSAPLGGRGGGGGKVHHARSGQGGLVGARGLPGGPGEVGRAEHGLCGRVVLLVDRGSRWFGLERVGLAQQAAVAAEPQAPTVARALA